ncbi:MAG TPA: hypothetical protein VFJ70_08830 [Burkholderiales bacterium]|nr:hypothetical protein [Burkholderiales bacterium]
MHAELVVPGLFAAPSAARLPAAELLIARGRCTSGASRGLEEWLHDAFDLGDEPLAAGALTLLAAGGEPAGYAWSRADPVHLRLMRDRLLLMPAAALRITSGEAEALCDALNRHFGERLALQVIDAGRWIARTSLELALGSTPPLALAGRDVALAMPTDTVVHQLLNEAQMVLHAHPVNEARETRGEPAINSVWLWGAERLASIGAPSWHSLSAEEPLALGLARAAGMRHRTLPASGAAWLERMPEDGRHLVVLDALRAPLALGETADYHEALARLEHDWFAPLLVALRDGRVGMVTIHVPDAGECTAYETIRGDLRRFWRRPRALEHYA